ncbi:4-hydroxy-tetrahydrodipicolinate synthase [Halobacillus karajensis]|uniref:4-hydroxy-tetrahydrodipicolinate synthase n=1 Tax=Halobacillus karajensis TaxID=195088 RepID=A0A059NX81_9BACI|nr:4-hydroxy-tetrahydrodipicolinate synthase [Halobacillus karajensis]CDQ18548.1 4-hydroxy-tetrahydrodipicolinate synthase [Halobacillus karajensis]CDQ23380.1 4-hydroxy-tetrahydrodipicolinate synthase [Halobacillus karajensis]CDQ26862.1 4-hydroxy-tetrahydrodipicolinate synthase [Halobacillus karajensis]SEH50069.1 4-hydroxy-tetrahydrodipicolinate synthase [Halobacillus karajensis]
MNFGQVLTAMVTPFDNKDNVDYEATRDLVNHLIENGSDALVIAGTTGESPTLTAEEKVNLYKFVVEVVDGRVPVIAGTGSNNTTASISLTKKAEEAGVDAIMLVTPYYNKPTQEGLYQHFSIIAAATSLPVMLYNIPGRSVVNMEPATIIRLSQIDNIVSVKEASGDLNAATEIIRETPDDFSVYSGEDSNTLPFVSIGGTGIVSVSSHVIGNEMQQMIQSFREGDFAYAARLHQKLLPVMDAIFSAPSPSPVKAALNAKGVQVGGVRLPLLPLTKEEESHVLSELEQVQLKEAVSVQ